MKKEYLKIKKQLLAIALASTIAGTSLTGCGSQEEENSNCYAIIKSDDAATIIEVESFYNNKPKEVLVFKDKKGQDIEVSIVNVILIRTSSYNEVEELARKIMGNEASISHY